MKVAVVGNGNVGLATFRELQSLKSLDEIVLVGRNAEKVCAEIDDYGDAAVLRSSTGPHMSAGGYDKTAGADIIIYAAGRGQKPGESRLDLVQGNVGVVRSIFSQIALYNQDAIIVVLSNPVDILTHEIWKVTGRPRHKVIGTGTLLDTARCKKHVANLLEVSPKSLNMCVVGEHGDSSVALMSSLRIMGLTLDEYLSNEVGVGISVNTKRLESLVQGSAGRIINAKGYTAYGVAAAATAIVSAITSNENDILPVTTVLQGEYGIDDLAISVPCVVGWDGVSKVVQLNMEPKEQERFENSVRIIREVQDSVAD